MTRILIVTDTGETGGLELWLAGKGFQVQLLGKDEDILSGIDDAGAGLIILYIANNTLANNMARIIKQEKKQPVIMLIPAEKISGMSLPVEADDFAAYPGLPDELYLRICRLLPGSGSSAGGEQLVCGDLVIDLASCEAGFRGEILELTYREYELLRFLASNRGRTFTREALLNRVWGYDYFGGDRTVDVHIQRLRTKINDIDRPYIETVRNIGYRFRKKD